jgi:hypothetical protein
MAAKTQAKYAIVTFELDDATKKFVKKFPAVLDGAKDLAVESMGRVFADGAKDITRADNHIDTAAYINSIGYAGNDRGPNGSEIGDIIHKLSKNGSVTSLDVGSGVSYAKYLEYRFNILARALDANLDDIEMQGHNTIKQYIKNRM